jgi:hypothetical protein
MRFPSIQDVARGLRDVNANVEGECDVRLQVWPDGGWKLCVGDASYDQNHFGFWGASSVPGVVCGKITRFDSKSVARDLIEQVKEHAFSQ